MLLHNMCVVYVIYCAAMLHIICARESVYYGVMQHHGAQRIMSLYIMYCVYANIIVH